VSFEPQQISVRELLRFNVEQFVEIIEEISDTAQKEHTLESAITKMEKEWEKIEFVLGYWKNRDIKMFQGGNLEDI
jgi:dynein heavy chain